MHLHSLAFPSGGPCYLSYAKPLGVTWVGYVGPAEAVHGGRGCLPQASPLHCCYLLNDNLVLSGPWFDSLEWLRSGWLPKAQRLGLRYVANVVQGGSRIDSLTQQASPFATGKVALPLLDAAPDAEAWLQSCQNPRLSCPSCLTSPAAEAIPTTQP